MEKFKTVGGIIDIIADIIIVIAALSVIGSIRSYWFT